MRRHGAGARPSGGQRGVSRPEALTRSVRTVGVNNSVYGLRSANRAGEAIRLRDEPPVVPGDPRRTRTPGGGEIPQGGNTDPGDLAPAHRPFAHGAPPLAGRGSGR